MTVFWFYAALLVITAVAFLLTPVLRRPRSHVDANRTGMNIGVYQERIAELQAQRNAGILDAAQLEAGRAEAALELLDDAPGARQITRGPLGRLVPLMAALATPLLAVVMYLHWGAFDELTLAKEHRGEPAPNIADVTGRLETLLAERPDSPEGWSLLGRAYMAQERAADAARAFERAADLAGRPAQMLGQWVQALYFAENRKWTPQLQRLTDEALASDPQNVLSLSVAAMGTFGARRYADAITYWERLQGMLPEGDPNRSAIADNIARARELKKSSVGSKAVP